MYVIFISCDIRNMQAEQMLFEQSQARFDPNNIKAPLQQYPCHVVYECC